MVRWKLIKLGLVLVALSLATSVLADEPKVILITIDGVRSSEFFNGTDSTLLAKKSNALAVLFKSIQQKILNHEGIILKSFLVSNKTNLSLPAYQSIFAGKVTKCLSNVCPAVSNETFLDDLIKNQKLTKSQVAVFSSWNRICDAVIKNKPKALLNCGQEELDWEFSDLAHEKINELQQKNKPLWAQARFDEYTFQHGFRYLQRFKPRFFYWAFNDTDEWGHLKNYAQHVQAIQNIDGYLNQLFNYLKSSPYYQNNTLVIVTTDHGRGEGSLKQFGLHSVATPEASKIWLYSFVQNSAVKINNIKLNQISTEKAEHIQLRATIEEFFQSPKSKTPAKPIDSILALPGFSSN